MKKPVAVAILMIVVLLGSAASSFAWSGRGGGVRHGGWQGRGGWHGGWHGGFHGHGVVVVGPGCCWGPYWGWGWGGYYPGPYYYQPQVVVQPAPVYTDSSQPAQPAESSYWYYCASSKAYYPNVQNCSEAWIKVPPRSE